MAPVVLTGMLLITYICEGAVIRKSSASNFLQSKRERRDAECYFGDCSRESSEVDEMLNTGPDYEETSDDSYEGGLDQNGNEETSHVLYDGNGEHVTEHEETLDVPDTGTAVHEQSNGQIPDGGTGVTASDHPAQMVNGPDGQKVHHDELGAVDGSGM